MIGDDREERRRKKLGRIVRAAAWSVGLGVGLLLARYMAPLLMGDSADANAGFAAFSFALVAYGGTQLAIVFLMRGQALKICPVVTYIIMPVVFIKLLMDMAG